MPPFGDINGGIGQNHVGILVPALLAGQGVVLENVRLTKVVQVQIHQRQPHHIRRNVIAFEVGRECPFLVRRQRIVTLIVGIGLENVLVRRNQESGSTAGRVENLFVFLRVNNGDNEVDDMTRSAELPGVPLRAKDREQIFKSIAEPLAVIVRKTRR